MGIFYIDLNIQGETTKMTLDNKDKYTIETIIRIVASIILCVVLLIFLLAIYIEGSIYSSNKFYAILAFLICIISMTSNIVNIIYLFQSLSHKDTIRKLQKLLKSSKTHIITIIAVTLSVTISFGTFSELSDAAWCYIIIIICAFATYKNITNKIDALTIEILQFINDKKARGK